jgi:hypothetical protein
MADNQSAAPAAPQDAIKGILDGIQGVDNEVRAQAWDAYHNSTSGDDFQKQMDGVNIPREIKAKLWDTKYPSPATTEEQVKNYKPSVPSRLDSMVPGIKSIYGSLKEHPLQFLEGAAAGAGNLILAPLPHEAYDFMDKDRKPDNRGIVQRVLHPAPGPFSVNPDPNSAEQAGAVTGELGASVPMAVDAAGALVKLPKAVTAISDLYQGIKNPALRGSSALRMAAPSEAAQAASDTATASNLGRQPVPAGIETGQLELGVGENKPQGIVLPKGAARAVPRPDLPSETPSKQVQLPFDQEPAPEVSRVETGQQELPLNLEKKPDEGIVLPKGAEKAKPAPLAPEPPSPQQTLPFDAKPEPAPAPVQEAPAPTQREQLRKLTDKAVKDKEANLIPLKVKPEEAEITPAEARKSEAAVAKNKAVEPGKPVETKAAAPEQKAPEQTQRSATDRRQNNESVQTERRQGARRESDFDLVNERMAALDKKVSGPPSPEEVREEAIRSQAARGGVQSKYTGKTTPAPAELPKAPAEAPTPIAKEPTAAPASAEQPQLGQFETKDSGTRTGRIVSVSGDSVTVETIPAKGKAPERMTLGKGEVTPVDKAGNKVGWADEAKPIATAPEAKPATDTAAERKTEPQAEKEENEKKPVAEEKPTPEAAKPEKVSKSEATKMEKRYGKVMSAHMQSGTDPSLAKAVEKATHKQLAEFANKEGLFKPGSPYADWEEGDLSRKGLDGHLSPNKDAIHGQLLTRPGLRDKFVKFILGEEGPGAVPVVKPTPKHPSGGFPVAEVEQGGHAGGGVVSEEELARNASNYTVSKGGQLSYHGKQFAPESTPSGSTHVSVRKDGTYLVNDGPDLTSSQLKNLSEAVGKKLTRAY